MAQSSSCSFPQRLLSVLCASAVSLFKSNRPSYSRGLQLFAPLKSVPFLHGAAFCSATLRGHDPTQKTLDKTAFREIVRLLIEAGADMNARTNENVPSEMGPRLVVQGETPLHFAAICGEAETVQLLLHGGADRHVETALGETPLDYAKKYRRSEAIVELLIPVPDLKATNSFSRISDSGDLLRISSRLIQIWYEMC